MAHFAKIENGVVQEILVVPDEQENRGQEFLANDCGLGGRWVQCSYNHNIEIRVIINFFNLISFFEHILI